MDEVIDKLKEFRLERYLDHLLKLGVTCVYDLLDITEKDQISFGCTEMEMRRWRKLLSLLEYEPGKDGAVGLKVNSQATNKVSSNSSPFKELDSCDEMVQISYCTLQPLYAKRVKKVLYFDPDQTTFSQMQKEILQQEGKGRNVSVQLYTFEGIPLLTDEVSINLTLREWFICTSSSSFFWVIFHSQSIIENSNPAKSLPPLDPNEGPCQIFVKHTRSYTLHVDPSKDSAITLRQKIFAKRNIPTSMIGLSYGKPLFDSGRSLEEYGIGAGSTIQMWIKPKKKWANWDDAFKGSTCYPSKLQSPEGLCNFNSCLRVLANRDVDDEKCAELLGFFHRVTQSPPLIVALETILRKKVPSLPHRIALNECLLEVFEAFLPGDIKSCQSNGTIFEYSSWFWSHIYNSTKATDAKEGNANEVSLTCPISLQHMKEPVRHIQQRQIVFDMESIHKKMSQGENIPGISENVLCREQDFIADYKICQLLVAYPETEGMCIGWYPSKEESSSGIDLEQPAKPMAPPTSNALLVNCPDIFRIYKASDLKGSHDSKSHLTHLDQNRIGVVTAYNKCPGQDIFYIYNPTTGIEETHKLDDLAKAVGTSLGSNHTFKKEGLITREPKECIVVVVDRSGSMGINVFPNFSRLDVVKQLFKTFADRTNAYVYPHAIGLTVFDLQVTMITNVSETIGLFQNALDSIEKGRGTSLWDALFDTIRQLDAFSVKYKDSILRILCLSDGEDTKSKHKPLEIVQLLQSKGIVLDCVLLGKGNTTAKALAHASNGCAFHPKSHAEALRLFQMETVLSIRERLVGQRKAEVNSEVDLAMFENTDNYPYDQQPPRPPPVEMKKAVTSPQKILYRAGLSNPVGLAAPLVQRAKRLLAEISKYQKDPHPNLHIYPCEDQLDFWRILLVGPQGTPYEGGVYLLYAKFPVNYPQNPPEIRFVTSIYHCNVNGHGKICHSVLDRNYISDMSIRQIFDCLFGLLLEPEPDDPLDSALAEEYFLDRHKYDREAQLCTQTHAKKTLNEWKEELLGKEATTLGTSNHPKHLLCPLTMNLLIDPVTTPYGYTYERSALEAALKSSREHEGMDPLAQKPLSKESLIPNIAIRQAVAEYNKSQSQTAWYLK